MRNAIITIILSLVLVCTSTGAFAAVSMEKRLTKATQIVDEFKQMPEKGIPKDVLNKAKGIAIYSMLKGGLIIGGRGGSGVLVEHNAATGTWSAPAAISIGGGSAGLQIGIEAVDLIFILNTDKALQALTKNSGTLGVDASIAAGPVGRKVEAGVMPDAAIYSYSRSKGAFIGISIEGAVTTVDKAVNKEFYGSDMTASEIISGKQLQPTHPGDVVDGFYKALVDLK